MKLLRLNGAPAAQLASPVRALCCASFEQAAMAPGKQYKLWCVLNCNYVGHNVVASSRAFSTLWRVSRQYPGLLDGYRALASFPFQASQFSTSQFPVQNRKQKALGPRAAGTLSLPGLQRCPATHALPPLPRRFHVHFCSLTPAPPPSLAPSVSVSNTAVNGDDADAAACRPRLLAPVRHLLSDAVRRGYAKYNSQGLARATSNPKFVAAPDAAIVVHYSAIIRSIVNYYSFVHGRSSLWKVTSIYRKSCALTLARKHSLRSAQAAFSKFGPKLRISTPDSRDDAVLLFYPDSLKTSGKFNMHSPRYSQVAILQEPFEKKRWR